MATGTNWEKAIAEASVYVEWINSLVLPTSYEIDIDTTNAQAELNRLKTQLVETRAQAKGLREEGWIQAAKIIEDISIPSIEAQVDKFARLIAGENFAERLVPQMQDTWRKVFDPALFVNPIEDFGESMDEFLLNELMRIFMEQSAAIPEIQKLGGLLAEALKDGIISAEEKSDLDMLKMQILGEFDDTTDALREAAEVLGLDMGELGFDASTNFGDSFASGMRGTIEGAMLDALKSGNIENIGEDIADKFNQSLMNTITASKIEKSALTPLLEKFGEDLYAALKDGVISPVENQMLRRQKAMLMRTSEQLGKDVDRVIKDLDMDFAQKEEAAARERGETEAFQTISNVTRFQANQIVAQLSMHTTFLKDIANSSAQTAMNTGNMSAPPTINNQISIGADDALLANQKINRAQALGLMTV